MHFIALVLEYRLLMNVMTVTPVGGNERAFCTDKDQVLSRSRCVCKLDLQLRKDLAYSLVSISLC